MIILLCIVCAVQFFFIAHILRKRTPAQAALSAPEPTKTDGEKEAFALLMGYNADIAYGVKRMTED